MAANIFVDIASKVGAMEGNVVSLSEIFRQHVNKKSDADIHTKPAVILIEDDLMKIFSSEATFEFDTTTGIISYEVWKTERNEVDIFNKCFGGNLRFVLKNYRSDSSLVIMALIGAFAGLFGGGKAGLSEIVSSLSKGRFDYDKNQKGEYRFWYRMNNNNWERSSLCLFTDYLYNTTQSMMKYEQSDDNLIDYLRKVENYHLGYLFIGYARFLAANM